MGRVFTSTVSLIICALVFAEGLKLSKRYYNHHRLGCFYAEHCRCRHADCYVHTFGFCFYSTGSANAAFFAFNSLLPHAAKAVNWDLIVMASCPVQLVSGIGRSMSPIAGVTIAVSSIAELSPFEVVRRTIPVMAIGMITVVLSSLILL